MNCLGRKQNYLWVVQAKYNNQWITNKNSVYYTRDDARREAKAMRYAFKTRVLPFICGDGPRVPLYLV